MQKWLIGVGLVIILAGILWPVLAKLGLGQLPGDIIIRRDGFTFYFPITTMLIVSAVLTILFRFFNR